MEDRALKIRRGDVTELAAINSVIESAVMNWPMAERVKRLSLPSLKYDEVDMAHLDVYVCVRGEEIIGVATLDTDYEASSRKGLLHGLYVLPLVQGQGIGKRLMKTAFDSALHNDLEAVLVRAERVSAGYFHYHELEAIEPANDSVYPYQFLKSLQEAA